jgi:hypothetical protein
MATKKQFLDYAGLSTLWGIINSTFATKTELDNVKKVAVGSFDEVAEADKLTITAKSVTGETVDTIVLGSASTTAAGLMSSADKSTLESLKETIDANTDFKGLQINGIAVATDAQANLKIRYVPKSDTTNAKIKLYDANNENAESEIDASDFVKDGMLDSVEVVEKDGKQVLRFTWNTDADKDVKDITDVELDKIITPYTAGEGITISDNTVSLNKAASDKLGGIKVGYATANQNYAVELDTDGKAYVAVPWTDTTYETGATQGTYVKVSVDGTSINSDDSALATALETLNTSKVATASGDDYVDAKVESGSTEVKVAAKQALKNAVKAANSAVQTVAKGTGIEVTTDGTTATVALDAATIASLGKADAAVKSVAGDGTLILAVTSDNAVSITPTDKLTNAVKAAEEAVHTVAEGTGIAVTKNGTTSTVALSEATIASLGKADSAIQGVKIGTAVASIGDDKVATFEADAVVTALGFAALTDAEIYEACGLTYPAPEA